MDSLGRVLRVILWGAVAGGLVGFVQQWRESNEAQMGFSQPQNLSAAIRLYRDPVCGTYVSPEISVKAEKSGQITHFCCEACRARHTTESVRQARA